MDHFKMVNIYLFADKRLCVSQFFSSSSQSSTITLATQSSSIATGVSVPINTATPNNVTSISLSAGKWSISGLVQFKGNPTVSGPQIASISITSATNGTLGDNSASSVFLSTSFTVGDISVVVPDYILTLVTPTTVFLVAQATFSGGTLSAYGRISAIKLST